MLWRKRRLRLAEAASYQHGLHATTQTYSKTAQSALVASMPKPSKIDVGRRDRRRAAVTPNASWPNSMPTGEMTLTAIEILGKHRNSAYEAALEALRREHPRGVGQAVDLEARRLRRRRKPYTADAAEPAALPASRKSCPGTTGARGEITHSPCRSGAGAGRSRSIPTSWNGSAATRSTSTASSSGRCPRVRLQELRRTKPPTSPAWDGRCLDIRFAKEGDAEFVTSTPAAARCPSRQLAGNCCRRRL